MIVSEPLTEDDVLLAEEDHTEKRVRRLARLHTRSVPALRLMGGNFLVLSVILHNAWITGAVDWSAVLWFTAFIEVYALATWVALRRWYDPYATIDLSLVFLAVDLVPLALTVHLTGGPASLLFWVFLFRVVDQTSTTFRRALTFTALGALAYLAVVLWATTTGTAVSWPAEAAKLLFLLLGGAYMAFTARAMERVRNRLSDAVHVARKSLSDLRERSMELERSREAAEAGSQAKSAFLSRVSHELRTPMNAILGFAQLLEMESELTEDQRVYVDEIMEGGRHLLDIINEVLDLARVETGSLAQEIEPVSLERAIAEVLERSQPAAAQRDVRIPDGPPSGSDVWVEGNARKIRQVFANLVSNAIKYNGSPGQVVVECRAAGDRVRVSVTDTGPGIPADRIEDAFTPFDRLGAESRGISGTGLGLSVARSLVEAMSGEIGVDTAVGKGSTFWFELRVTDAPALHETEERKEGTMDGSRNGPLVLYIDDKPENVMLVRRILARRPTVELISTPVGLKGIEEARSRRPDLILLDMELPDIAGREVLGRLRADADTRDIPVVVVSAEASRAKVERVLQEGAHAYFTMPYDVVKFLDVIDEVLELS